MKHIALENELKGHIKKRRIIELIACAVFLTIAIAFTVAYDQSKVIEEIYYGPIKHQSVTYNYSLAWGVLAGWLGFIPSIIFLITDVILSKVVTIEIGNDYITFYRGVLRSNLYVNGEYADGLYFGYLLEATLSDGTKIIATLGKWSAHIAFSNGHPSIHI